MCGINGFIKFKNQGKDAYPMERMKSLVHTMNDKIIHRGPDDEGLYTDLHCALGMRRLSIVDLDTGSQPIYNTDKTKLVIFNGEIYNYQDLKDDLTAEGCVFQTKSDTEVLLLGYENQGIDFITRLDGMFAFCIYDTVKQKWTLGRDRAGEKPLYYYKGNDFFLFGSELKSLLSSGLVNIEINTEALTTYFQLGYIPAPLSIIDGVKKLMPATVMEIKIDGEITTTKYWSLTVDDNEKYSDYGYCKRELRNKLFASVERRMISDVSLGAFLSGGFDSSIIVGIMSQMSSQPIDTFSVGFKEKIYDESEMAAITAKHNGTNHHTITLDWDEAVKSIDELLDNMDEPFADPSLVASYAVSKMTREYVTVALSGDASDELFAGYNKYLMPYYSQMYQRVPKVFRKGLIEAIINHLPTTSDLFRKASKVITNAEAPVELQVKRMMCRAFSYNECQEMIPAIQPSKMNFIKWQFDELKSSDIQKRTQYVDFHTVLEGQMLPKVDRASMRASLETRVPMLDRDIIELAFSMPSEFKIDRHDRKKILKETFKDLLPEELFKTSKHGFDVPVGVWMMGTLKPRLDKYTEEKYLRKQCLFNKTFIDRHIEKNQPMNVDWSTKLWSFFVFQHWYERYID